jgi:hypothetical protein
VMVCVGSVRVLVMYRRFCLEFLFSAIRRLRLVAHRFWGRAFVERKETFSVALLFLFAKTIVDFSNKQKLGEKYIMIHRNLLNVNWRSVFMIPL